MSACARHNQRSNSAVLNRIQITGLSAGQFPFGVPGSGEFRLHRLPGLRADLKDTLIYLLHLLRSPADCSSLVRVTPPALCPTLYLFIQLASGFPRSGRGPPGSSWVRGRPSRSPKPKAPEPLGLILRLGEAPHLAHHPIDSPLGSGQSPPDLGRRRP